MGITIPIDRSVQLATNVRRALVIRCQVVVNYGFFLRSPFNHIFVLAGGHEASTKLAYQVQPEYVVLFNYRFSFHTKVFISV
jgi:hypothetical protein